MKNKAKLKKALTDSFGSIPELDHEERQSIPLHLHQEALEEVRIKTLQAVLDEMPKKYEMRSQLTEQTTGWIEGYNQALDDILTIINKEK